MDKKDPAGHAAWAVEEIRVFFSGFPRSRRAERIKWWAAGVRQLICLLMATRLSTIAVDSGLAHGREALPHRDSDYFQRSQEKKRRLSKADGLEKDEPNKLFFEVRFWLFQLLLSSSSSFYFILFFSSECACLLCFLFGATSKKGQHFNSGEMRRGEKNMMGRGRGRGLIRKNANSTEMAVVIQLSPWALKILVLSLGVYLFFLCQNCPPCTQVD